MLRRKQWPIPVAHKLTASQITEKIALRNERYQEFRSEYDSKLTVFLVHFYLPIEINRLIEILNALYSQLGVAQTVFKQRELQQEPKPPYDMQDSSRSGTRY